MRVSPVQARRSTAKERVSTTWVLSAIRYQTSSGRGKKEGCKLLGKPRRQTIEDIAQRPDDTKPTLSDHPPRILLSVGL